MLDDTKIAGITREVGREKLTPRWFEDVMIEPAVDSEGNDALGITVILTRKPDRHLKGKILVRFLVELRQRFDALGEGRTPLLHWATREELAADDDTES
jgi:hypothetical protein